MALILFLFSICLHLVQAAPWPGSPVERQAPTWTTLPAKLSSVSACSSSETGCYATDVTYTVTTLTGTVTTTSNGVGPTRSPTATVMAVKNTVGTYWPPPVMTAYVGQRVRITLVNERVPGKADENVTLHFHGLLQKNGYGIYDGPESVTQW